MEDFEDYESWLEKLKDIANIEGVNLSLDKFHYHTYFMRGWCPDSVISDIASSKP